MLPFRWICRQYFLMIHLEMHRLQKRVPQVHLSQWQVNSINEVGKSGVFSCMPESSFLNFNAALDICLLHQRNYRELWELWQKKWMSPADWYILKIGICVVESFNFSRETRYIDFYILKFFQCVQLKKGFIKNNAFPAVLCSRSLLFILNFS